MKRDLQFVKDAGMLAEVLGLSEERCAFIDLMMNEMIERNYTLRQAVETMNDMGEFSDAEWTCFMYALGWYQARRMAG